MTTNNKVSLSSLVKSVNSNSKDKSAVNSFYWEESNVKLDGAAADLLKFKQHCNAMREFLQAAKASKNTGDKINWSSFATQLITIKELNRETQFRIRKARELTEKQKLDVDKLHLNLQNMLYEVSHLENEIKTCLEQRSQHEKINLISPEEFYKVTGRTPSSLSPHEETLERLYWELDQRKQLALSCDKLKNSVELVSQEISQKRKYLNSFGPKLKEIADATLSVQNTMNLPFSNEETQYSLAFLLPTPLYILFTHFKSYITMSGEVSDVAVTIEGDAELARAVNSSLEHSNSGSTLNIADESDGDEQESLKKRKKTGRHKGKSGVNGAKHLTSNVSSELHPLVVLVKFTHSTEQDMVVSKPAVELSVSFAWMLNTKLVTVRIQVQTPSEKVLRKSVSGSDVLCSELLLSSLQCAAFGSSADMPILCQSNESTSWEQLGRSFSWAQQLAGLHCYPSSADQMCTEKPTEFGYVADWIRAVQKRLSSRINLINELVEIESNRPCLSKQQQALLPTSSDVKLVFWSRDTFENLQSVVRARVPISLDLIQPIDLIFKAEFRHSDQSSLTVWVAVPPEYPDKAPMFVIDAIRPGNADSNFGMDLSDLHLQELEAELNCYWDEFFAGLPDSELTNVLSCQLARCASCFGALCSTNSSSQSGFRCAKYPSRSRPLRYLPSAGTFIHR